ncbi:hypothetical protein D918_06602 [Trichuris suis]|nr:hypothetical protein D918_06602 [Trichuris suis]
MRLTENYQFRCTESPFRWIKGWTWLGCLFPGQPRKVQCITCARVLSPLVNRPIAWASPSPFQERENLLRMELL